MPPSKRKTGYNSDWVRLLPFLLFCLAFEVVPILFLIRGSVMDKTTSQLTIQHYLTLNHPLYLNSFLNSIKISGLTAIVGVLFGTFIGYAIYRWPSRRVQEILITLSDVTTNFAGAPLAFAFVVILGMNGVITQFFLEYFQYELYPTFSIYSFSGLTLAYIYFQLPLMVLLILPAFAGIKKEWRESAQSLGANTFQFWWHIGIPVLMPSLIAGVNPSFCERIRRLCHRLHVGRGQAVSRNASNRIYDRRRGSQRPRDRHGDGRCLFNHHGFEHRDLSGSDDPRATLVEIINPDAGE